MYNKEFFLRRIPVKYSTIGCTLFFLILNFPDFFAYQIKYSGEANVYLLTLTDLGKSSWFSIYYSIVVFIMFIFMSVLIVLNGTIIHALNIEIRKRRRDPPSEHEAVSQEPISIKITVCINVYYILVRFIHLIALIVFRIDSMNGIIYSPNTNLLRKFDYLLTASSFCLRIFVYAYFNKAIRRKITDPLTPE